MSNESPMRIIAPQFQPSVDRASTGGEGPAQIIAPPFSPAATREPPPPEASAEPAPQLSRQEQAIDFLKSTGLGMARGFVGMPGIIGSIGQMADIAPISTQYYGGRFFGGQSREVAQKAYDEAMERLRATQTPEERAGTRRNIFGIPFITSQGMLDLLKEKTGADLEYTGQTPASRVAGVVGEFAGGIPAGAPIRAAKAVFGSAPAARSMARTEIIPALTAGTASGGLGEIAASNPDLEEYEGLLRVAGGLGGAGAGVAGQARFLPAAQREAAARLAGDIARGQISDQPTRWQRYQSALFNRRTPAERQVIEQLNYDPTQYAPGVRPTTGMLLPNEPGIRGLGDLPPQPGVESAQNVAAQSRQALAAEAGNLKGVAEQSLVAPDMATVLGLPVGANPMGQSSTAARSVFDAVHDVAFKAKEDAWSNPAIAQARYKTNDVTQALNAARTQMGDATYQNMPVELRRYIENIETYGANGVPLTELQKIKSFANEIARNPNVLDRSGAVALTVLLDDVMTNTNNVMPRFMSGTTYTQAAPAWDAARTATRKYYDSFGSDLFQSLAERYPAGTPQAGQPVVPNVQFLDRILGSPRDALANFDQLSAIPNIDRAALNTSVGDWLIGKLTDNNSPDKIMKLTGADIDKFVRTPGNAELVSRIPGLQDRLNDIATQSRGERVISAFENVLKKPDPINISNFIKNYRRDLDQVFTTPEQREFLGRLDRSSQLLHDFGRGSVTPTKINDLLQNGDLFTILHGWAGGTMGRIGAGAAAGSVLGSTVLGMASEFGFLGGAAGAFSGIPSVTRTASNIIYGNLAERAAEILQKATTDPRLMQELLRKPTIQDVFNPFSVNGWAYGFRETLPETALTLVRSQEEMQRLRLDEESARQREQPRRAGGRVGRASGGRLMRNDHSARAAALIRAAEAAKKAHNATTEGILEQPDEAVAKALSIANKAI
jgi:hypothetical protein